MSVSAPRLRVVLPLTRTAQARAGYYVCIIVPLCLDLPRDAAGGHADGGLLENIISITDVEYSEHCVFED